LATVWIIFELESGASYITVDYRYSEKQNFIYFFKCLIRFLGKVGFRRRKLRCRDFWECLRECADIVRGDSRGILRDSTGQVRVLAWLRLEDKEKAAFRRDESRSKENKFMFLCFFGKEWYIQFDFLRLFRCVEVDRPREFRINVGVEIAIELYSQQLEGTVDCWIESLWNHSKITSFTFFSN